MPISSRSSQAQEFSADAAPIGVVVAESVTTVVPSPTTLGVVTLGVLQRLERAADVRVHLTEQGTVDQGLERALLCRHERHEGERHAAMLGGGTHPAPLRVNPRASAERD